MSSGRLVYHELIPISREEAEAVFRAGEREVGIALLRLALHDPDWEHTEARCLEFLDHPDVWVRRNACTSLGHLARLHQRLHLERVMPRLLALTADPEVGGYADDALDDIEMFMKVKRRRYQH